MKTLNVIRFVFVLKEECSVLQVLISQFSQPCNPWHQGGKTEPDKILAPTEFGLSMTEKRQKSQEHHQESQAVAEVWRAKRGEGLNMPWGQGFWEGFRAL